MTAGPTGKRLVLEVSKAMAYAGHPIQVNLSVLDADGSGYGTRLAGPKFSGARSELLRSTELDDRARRDIRLALNRVDGRLITSERVDQACEVMHDAYEKAAVGAGWETNPESRKPWTDVPEANKATMRAAVRALLEWQEGGI